MREILRNSDCYLLNKEGFMFKIDKENFGGFDIPKEGYAVEVTSLAIGEEIDDVISAMLFLMDNPMVEIENELYELCIGGYFEEADEKYRINLYALIENKNEAINLGKLANKNEIYCVKDENIILI